MVCFQAGHTFWQTIWITLETFILSYLGKRHHASRNAAPVTEALVLTFLSALLYKQHPNHVAITHQHTFKYTEVYDVQLLYKNQRVDRICGHYLVAQWRRWYRKFQKQASSRSCQGAVTGVISCCTKMCAQHGTAMYWQSFYHTVLEEWNTACKHCVTLASLCNFSW